MLKCLICFILGWLVSRQMGNGFSVSCESDDSKPDCVTLYENFIKAGEAGSDSRKKALYGKFTDWAGGLNGFEEFKYCVQDYYPENKSASISHSSNNKFIETFNTLRSLNNDLLKAAEEEWKRDHVEVANKHWGRDDESAVIN